MIVTPESSTEPMRMLRRSTSFLRVDDVDVIALLVAQHRALRKQRRGRPAGADPRLGEAAGADRRVVGNGDSHFALARLRVDHRRYLPHRARRSSGRARSG